MKITSINYNKSFAIAPFLQEKIGVEIQLDDTDDHSKAFQLAKETVERFHKEGNPNLPDQLTDFNEGPIPIPEQIITPQERRIGLFVKDIEDCKDMVTLSTYKFLVKGKPDLEIAFEKRLKELGKGIGI